LRTFNNEIGSLILGGFFRGKEIKFTDLAKEIEQSKVRNIFFLPETGIMIFEELLQAGFELKVDNYTPYTLIEIFVYYLQLLPAIICSKILKNAEIDLKK
jgi:hypothetical protein